MQGLISRSPFPEEMLRILTNSVMELEKEARECYAGPIDYSPDEFVKILVIDGCFIIELLRKSADVELREENDPIFSMACMLQFLFHDLILLENQVPWMVLEHLFNVVSLIKLLKKIFTNFTLQSRLAVSLLSETRSISLTRLGNCWFHQLERIKVQIGLSCPPLQHSQRPA